MWKVLLDFLFGILERLGALKVPTGPAALPSEMTEINLDTAPAEAERVEIEENLQDKLDKIDEASKADKPAEAAAELLKRRR